MQLEDVEISQLNPAVYNPRVITDEELDALAASFDRWGNVQNIVVNRRNMVIVGGHQRVKVAQRLGHATIPVCFVDLDDADEMALNLALNKTGGQFDPAKLQDIIRGLKGLDFSAFQATGFSEKEISQLGGLAGFGNKKPVASPDSVPEAPKVAITQPGDVYTLGLHRLICGDHADLQTVKTLMDGDKADIVCTDPPYNIGSDKKITGHGKGSKKNTTTERLMASEWDRHFKPEAMLNNVATVLAANCSVYLFSSHLLAGLYWSWMETVLDWHHFAVWAKPNPAPSLNKRHWTSSLELICHGTRGKHTFNFPAEGHALNLFQFNKPAKCDLHPTMKPVELIEHILSTSSKPNDVVLDACGGSGTTMVAAERTDRKARMVERDPIYCDIIVQRMRDIFPELVITRNGKPFK